MHQPKHETLARQFMFDTRPPTNEQCMFLYSYKVRVGVIDKPSILKHTLSCYGPLIWGPETICQRGYWRTRTVRPGQGFSP